MAFESAKFIWAHRQGIVAAGIVGTLAAAAIAHNADGPNKNPRETAAVTPGGEHSPSAQRSLSERGCQIILTRTPEGGFTARVDVNAIAGDTAMVKAVYFKGVRHHSMPEQTVPVNAEFSVPAVDQGQEFNSMVGHMGNVACHTGYVVHHPDS